MGCSSSTQTQTQENSRPVTKTGVTNGLKQSAASDGNSSVPNENEICLDKTKQCSAESKVDGHDKIGPTNNLLTGETKSVMPLAIDSSSSTCEEEYPGKAESPGSRKRNQAEYPRSADKANYSGPAEESVTSISAGKNEPPITAEKDCDREIENSTLSPEKFVEIEIFGTIKEIRPLNSDGKLEPLETGECSQHLGMAQEADLQRTTEDTKHLVTSKETEPQEIMENIQHVETDRNKGVLEGNDYVETVGKAEDAGTLEETDNGRTTGETEPSEIHEQIKNKETAGKTEPSGTLEETDHEGTAGENEPSGVWEKAEHEGRAGNTELSVMLETTEHDGTTGETKASEKMDESENEGTDGKIQPLEIIEKKALETGEKNNLLGPAEDSEFPEILGEIQPLGALGKKDNYSTDQGTESPERMKKIQLVETVGGTKPPIIDEGTQENTKSQMEEARKIHMKEEDQTIEGETGERVETETNGEIVSEGSETKEEETGEAVDTTAATEIELTNSKK